MGNLWVPAENGQQSYSEVVFKDSKEGKSASSTPDDLLCVKEEIALGENTYTFQGDGQWPVHLIRGLKEKGLEDTGSEVWGGGVFMDIWECTQSRKISASHVNVHQKASTMRWPVSSVG